MNFDDFLQSLKSDSSYADQIVYVHEAPAREAEFADLAHDSDIIEQALKRLAIDRLYSHQATAIDHALQGKNVLISTRTASGKTLGYMLPILEKLDNDERNRALLLYPTKALCQDQFKNFVSLLDAAGQNDRMAGVFDGDSPANLRRKLRDSGAAIFSNPDMIHAALLPQHGRWARFLAGLRYIVLDELHVYNGIFGSNMAHLIRRLLRICRHYGSSPQFVCSSATIANPIELAERLTGLPFELVNQDGSPRGRKTYVLWNPPRIKARNWRSRRSANVEAHELMAKLVEAGIPTITFSKAKMTAEMIHRYVTEALRKSAPQLAHKVTPYRGGYLPSERREIEHRLFSGELLGVSTTPALELGIDVGSLEASILVGYPGTLASFFQQAGRAGRKERDSIVFFIGLDTSINQYIMSNPEYVFERCVEQAVIEPENPFVTTNHLRCAAQEQAIDDEEVDSFGPHAPLALQILQENHKVNHLEARWFHAANEIPQHEVSLRDTAESNVLIEDVDSGEVIGEVNVYDAEPILHPEAIYMHLGDSYRVLSLDLEKDLARVKRVDVDYYTQPKGGTDVHHIDNQLREKQFGSGQVFWGEVTAYFNTYAYEKIRFYELDALSVHGLELPTLQLETMAFWMLPPESVLNRVRRAGLDAFAGLRGLGYATRMLLPMFITCDTLDFSHSVGSANSPWNAVFIYERFPHGLGFTEKAFDRLHEIMPQVLENVRDCPCDECCPCCVGKPLRQRTTWNVERGEGSIPSKVATLMILEGYLGDGSNLQQPDANQVSDSGAQESERLERALRRRLERGREPKVFHPIKPQPEIKTDYPELERPAELEKADVQRRAERRNSFDRDLHKRIAKKLGLGGKNPMASRHGPPRGMKTRHGVVKPTDFPGRPQEAVPKDKPVVAGDELAARARKLMKKKRKKK